MKPLEKSIYQHIISAGGEPYITGGTVRDKMLGVSVRDTDVVVFGMDEQALCKVLERFGQVLNYGKSFRVYQVRGLAVEFSLPRNQAAQQEMTMEQRLLGDAEGRDFTVNALYMNPLTEEIMDPLGGQEDLRRRHLRMTSEHTFEDDPLRVLRGIQLRARMGFIVEDTTLDAMRKVSLHSVATERIYDELNKWLLGENPGKGWEIMVATGHVPEICRTEMGFYDGMGAVLLKAASLRSQATKPGLWMWGVLLSTSLLSSTSQHHKGQLIKGYGELVRKFEALSNHAEHTHYVSEILWGLCHFQDHSWREPDVKRLSLGVNLDDMTLVVEALTPYWKQMGNQIQVLQAMNRVGKMRPQHKIRPLVKGSDLNKWGFSEGKVMGVLLETAFQMQLEGITKGQMEQVFKKYRQVFQKMGH
mgnify:CR=1 FL=1